MTVELDPDWTRPCDGVTLDEHPRTNEELLGLAEGAANALRECDERMGKIRDAQP